MKVITAATCLALTMSLFSSANSAKTGVPKGVAQLLLDLRIKEVEALTMTDCYSIGDNEWRDPSQAWLSSVPDSLVARATGKSPKVQLRAHCDDALQGIRIKVHAGCDLVRSTSATASESGLRLLWTWDLRDSTGHRVPDGIYRVEASVGERSSVGWVVVGSPDPAR